MPFATRTELLQGRRAETRDQMVGHREAWEAVNPMWAPRLAEAWSAHTLTALRHGARRSATRRRAPPPA